MTERTKMSFKMIRLKELYLCFCFFLIGLIPSWGLTQVAMELEGQSSITSITSIFMGLQEKLIFANQEEKRAVTREEWTSWQGELKNFSEQTLVNWHNQLEAESIDRLAWRSKELGINLDEIRESSFTLDAFCRSVPKGGLLHVHPMGTMSRDRLKKLLTSINPVDE